MDTSRRDHYSVLGVPRDASGALIREAYRERAKRLHPDRDPSPQAAERFRELHQAYATLRDPLLRLAYDARFRPPPHPDPRYSARPRQAAPPRTEPSSLPHGRSWAFIGLHLTGLVFGVVLVLGLCIGTTFGNWPWYGLFFAVPGLLIIPDAWEGLRM